MGLAGLPWRYCFPSFTVSNCQSPTNCMEQIGAKEERSREWRLPPGSSDGRQWKIDHIFVTEARCARLSVATCVFQAFPPHTADLNELFSFDNTGKWHQIGMERASWHLRRFLSISFVTSPGRPMLNSSKPWFNYSSRSTSRHCHSLTMQQMSKRQLKEAWLRENGLEMPLTFTENKAKAKKF